MVPAARPGPAKAAGGWPAVIVAVTEAREVPQ